MSSSMAKIRFGRTDWVSYRRPNKVFRVDDVDYQVGDCVLIRSSGNNSAIYVARVDEIDADNLNNLKFHVRRYYRPEEAGGRKQFHGKKELFLSDHFDIESSHTIQGKCIVHTFKNYTKLEEIGQHDYYCRFEYKPDIGVFMPDRVEVYCKCEMPYNPDDLMIQCEECWDWYHPHCLNMTKEQAVNLEQFICCGYSSDEDVNNKLVLHVDEACVEITDHLEELDEISKRIFAENENLKIDLGNAKRQLAFVKADPQGESSELLDIIRGMEAEVKTLEKKKENILRRILQKRRMVRRRAVIDFMRSLVYEQLLNRQVETGFKRALSQLKHMKIIPREFHHDIMNVYRGDDLKYSEGEDDDLAPDDLSGHEFGEMLDMNLDDDEQLEEEGDDGLIDVNDLISGGDGGAGNDDGSNNLVGQNF